MTTDTLEEKKYDLRIDEDVERAHFKPVQTDFSIFYKCLLDNYDNNEIIYQNHDDDIKSASYHHVSGATILTEADLLNGDGGDIFITGTRKAISDAQASLELLTQWELKEVSRDITRVAQTI